MGKILQANVNYEQSFKEEYCMQNSKKKKDTLSLKKLETGLYEPI
jgi:hypothetical protein